MIVNALIGAVVTIAASFALGPLGPILGGVSPATWRKRTGL